MIKKCYLSFKKFCYFIAFTVFLCASSSVALSAVPNSITVPKEFLAYTATAMQNFHKETGTTLPQDISAVLSRFSNTNILIAGETTSSAIYISGKSPIMSTTEKDTIQPVLSSQIFDVFDVILPTDKVVFVRNSLLAYAICCSLVSYTNNLADSRKPFQKGLIISMNTAIQQLVPICKTTSQLAKFEKILEQLLKDISSPEEEIDKLFSEMQTTKEQEATAKERRNIALAAIQTAKRESKSIEGQLTTDFQSADENLTRFSVAVQSIKKGLDEIKIGIYESIDKLLKEIFPDLSKIAYEANDSYFAGMEAYYNQLSGVSSEASTSALFGLNVLRGSNQDIQIAYIVAPNGNTEQVLRESVQKSVTPLTTNEIFVQQWKLAATPEAAFWKAQPMYGVVKMSHSEPMYIFRSLLNPSIKCSFFFTQRDMCETCSPIIGSYAQLLESLFIAVSQQSCTGQISSLSKVDYIYKGGTFAKEETDPEEIISSICRVRIPILTESAGKNIIVKFDDLSIEAVD